MKIKHAVSKCGDAIQSGNVNKLKEAYLHFVKMTLDKNDFESKELLSLHKLKLL